MVDDSSVDADAVCSEFEQWLYSSGDYLPLMLDSLLEESEIVKS